MSCCVVYVKDARNRARLSEGLQEEPLRVTHCMSQHSHTVEKWPHPSFLITWYLPLNKSPIFTGWYPPERDNERVMAVTGGCV